MAIIAELDNDPLKKEEKERYWESGVPKNNSSVTNNISTQVLLQFHCRLSVISGFF
jgi:hypothetical protein